MEAKTGLTTEKLNCMYPEVYKRSYSLPSAHFNQWNLKTKEADNPQVYTSVRPQQSERRGSEAQQRALYSFQILSGEVGPGRENQSDGPMFILSGVHFENVLKKKTPKPSCKKRKQKTTGVQPKKIKGEADIIVIEKHVGLVIIEVKSFGDNIELKEDYDKTLLDVLEKTKKTYRDTESVESGVPATSSAAVSVEIPNHSEECNTDKQIFGSWIKTALQLDIPVSSVVALPNVPRSVLERVALGCPKFLEMLDKVGLETKTKSPLDILRTGCLCREEFAPQFQYPDTTEQAKSSASLKEWWKNFSGTVRKGETMSKTDYETLVAAFVGPYSEVSVWSPKDKRVTSRGRLVQTQDDVLQEAGSRFQKYVLYPNQLQLYKFCHKQRVYLTGPPGCGKTLLLILKAVKWVSEGRHVIIVSSDLDNSVAQPVCIEMEQKITEIIKLLQEGEAASEKAFGTVWLASSFGTKAPASVISEVLKYLRRKRISADRVVFLLDEVIDDKSGEVAKKLRCTFPNAFIWTAGPWPGDKPAKFHKIEMSPGLRCPPVIQQFLRDTERDCHEKHSYSYTVCSTADEEYLLPTDGPPIKWLSHEGHPDDLFKCWTCGNNLGNYLVNELHIGAKDGRLNFTDVIIVTHATSLKKTKFLKGLREAHVRVKAIESGSGKENCVAFPDDFAVATDITLVLGLERMVVVFVPESLMSGDVTGCARRAGRKDQQGLSQHRRLRALGEDNRRALWYVLSRSLSKGVVFHFGEGDSAENSSCEADADETDSAESSVSDNEDSNSEVKQNPEKENQANPSTEMCGWKICSVLVLFLSLLLYFFYPICSANIGRPQTLGRQGISHDQQRSGKTNVHKRAGRK